MVYDESSNMTHTTLLQSDQIAQSACWFNPDDSKTLTRFHLLSNQMTERTSQWKRSEMKSWLYIKEESIYYFQLLRNWLVGDREAELENFESTRFHLYVELFFFGFIFSNDVIVRSYHLVEQWICYVIIKPILCLEADDDWLRSSDWLNLVFRSIFWKVLLKWIHFRSHLYPDRTNNSLLRYVRVKNGFLSISVRFDSVYVGISPRKTV